MAILHHTRALARRIAVGDDRVSRMHVGAMTRAAMHRQDEQVDDAREIVSIRHPPQMAAGEFQAHVVCNQRLYL
jgi:hypothetical protein